MRKRLLDMELIFLLPDINYQMVSLQQRIWNPTWLKKKDEISGEIDDSKLEGHREQTIGFSVKNAVLFPPEVEKGRWPENYFLSDHARLTVVFSPIRMPRLISWTSIRIPLCPVLCVDLLRKTTTVWNEKAFQGPRRIRAMDKETPLTEPWSMILIWSVNPQPFSWIGNRQDWRRLWEFFAILTGLLLATGNGMSFLLA